MISHLFLIKFKVLKINNFLPATNGLLNVTIVNPLTTAACNSVIESDEFGDNLISGHEP